MVAKAILRYARISSKKMRLIVPLVKGKKVLEAQAILKSLNKRGARILEKLLKSAISNAKNKGFLESKLFISKLIVNEGPFLKRYRAASFGRAVMIRKRTSHILVELDTPERIVEEVKIR
ncbi:MAG: 50S ribosomal protein L22 [Candidatus Omnitrophica bacterium 4484_70.2]|nr:MAG: 50S ribosomal protein L22 [Candidatus Omnitrophica bacterium 4484_70.2]